MRELEQAKLASRPVTMRELCFVFANVVAILIVVAVHVVVAIIAVLRVLAVVLVAVVALAMCL